MSKFAVGDAVKKAAGENGVVIAIFTTDKGEPRYAVESEGALQFILETKLLKQTRH